MMGLKFKKTPKENSMYIKIEKKLYSVKETAAMLGISPRTIYNKTHRKAKSKFPLKPVRVGRSVKFSFKDIESFCSGAN